MSTRPIIAITAPVEFQAAAKEDGEANGPPAFTSIFYTGGAMEINGYDLPVVVDLAGLSPGNVLVLFLPFRPYRVSARMTAPMATP